MEICCLSVTRLILSPISLYSPFENELGINLQDLERLMHTISSDVPLFFLFFWSIYDLLSATHILISTKLKSCSVTPPPHPTPNSHFLFVLTTQFLGPNEILGRYTTFKQGLNISGEEGVFVTGWKNYKGLSVRHICLPNVISG